MKINSTNNKVPQVVGHGLGHLAGSSTHSVPGIDVNYTASSPPYADTCPPGSDEDGQGVSDIGAMLDKFDNVHDGWSSQAVKRELHDKYDEWLANVCRWSNFLTLTFKDEKPPDKAYEVYIRLVRALNEKLFGEHYTRIVHHSYFNYIVGMEFTHNRDVCHFHVLTDRPMDYKFVHSWWNIAAGICWIEQVRDNVKTVRYVTKYVCKGGEDNIKVYLTSNHRVPIPLPEWWYQG